MDGRTEGLKLSGNKLGFIPSIYWIHSYVYIYEFNSYRMSLQRTISLNVSLIIQTTETIPFVLECSVFAIYNLPPTYIQYIWKKKKILREYINKNQSYENITYI